MPPVSPAPSPVKKKGGLIAAIIASAVLILGGGVFALFHFDVITPPWDRGSGNNSGSSDRERDRNEDRTPAIKLENSYEGTYFSFDYPEAWTLIPYGEFDVTIEGDGIGFSVDYDYDGFSAQFLDGDEDSVKQLAEDYGLEFVSFSDVKIDGVDGKKTVVKAGEKTIVSYYYRHLGDVYEVGFEFNADKAAEFNPIIDAIMKSYKLLDGSEEPPEDPVPTPVDTAPPPAAAGSFRYPAYSVTVHDGETTWFFGGEELYFYADGAGYEQSSYGDTFDFEWERYYWGGAEYLIFAYEINDNDFEYEIVELGDTLYLYNEDGELALTLTPIS
jgi:hypothetical protein